MLRPKSEDTISETMIYAMIPEIGFSKDDLLCNKSDMLSSSQVKNCRKKLKEYDPDPSIGTFNFVFAGSKTIETYNVNEEYFQRLQPFFTDEPNVFMFNVKYKICFEEHQNSFLSIKLIEILDKQLYQPNTILISKDKQRIENKHRKELKTTTKKDTSSLRITLSFMITGICFILFISKNITNSDVNIFLIISGIISTIIFLRENNMNQIQK